MVSKAPHYGLAVAYEIEREIVTKKCASAHVLIAATSASVMEKLNEGYQLTTENVKDPFKEAWVCTLVSFCTLTSAPDYQLKPKRGSLRQLAFATIVDVLDPGSAGKPPVFMATAIDKVVDDEAGAAPHHMSRTLFFAAMAARTQGRGECAPWSEDCSPANASKCRRLGKSPTDDMLDSYAANVEC